MVPEASPPRVGVTRNYPSLMGGYWHCTAEGAELIHNQSTSMEETNKGSSGDHCGVGKCAVQANLARVSDSSFQGCPE